jgi:hypothetical protein
VLDVDVNADAAPDPTAAHKALSSGPVLLSEADGKKLLSQELKSGKDLIQTPFGNLPQISEKVKAVHSCMLVCWSDRSAFALGCRHAVPAALPAWCVPYLTVVCAEKPMFAFKPDIVNVAPKY